MADPSELSKRERQIMDVVYAHGEATIAQLHAELPDPPMRGASDSRLGQGGANPPATVDVYQGVNVMHVEP